MGEGKGMARTSSSKMYVDLHVSRVFIVRARLDPVPVPVCSNCGVSHDWSLRCRAINTWVNPATPIQLQVNSAGCDVHVQPSGWDSVPCVHPYDPVCWPQLVGSIHKFDERRDSLLAGLAGEKVGQVVCFMS